jgi:DNA-binding NarL/FixJ family response regulator
MNTDTEVIRVLVADDEPLVRAGVVSILSTDPGVDVVAQTSTGTEALEYLRAHQVDVAVLDIRMPGLSGLEVLGQMRRESSATRCVFVTTFGEDDYVARAIGLGVDGFVLKAGDPRELLMGLHAAASGGAFFSPSVARRLLGGHQARRLSHQQHARTLFDRLTPREKDVLRLIGQGRSNTEIASELYMAATTVKTHITSILRSTSARNRVEAALVAVRAGEA